MAPAQGWHAKSWSVPHFWPAWKGATSQSIKITGPRTGIFCDTDKSSYSSWVLTVLLYLGWDTGSNPKTGKISIRLLFRFWLMFFCNGGGGWLVFKFFFLNGGGLPDLIYIFSSLQTFLPTFKFPVKIWYIKYSVEYLVKKFPCRIVFFTIFPANIVCKFARINEVWGLPYPISNF